MASWNIHKMIPKRYILSLFGFFGFIIASALGSNLSIAIVAMVDPSIPQSSHNSSLLHSENLNWSSETQGYILSSLFYGYTIIQIPAGFLATKLGGTFLFGFGISLAGVLSLFIPLCGHAKPVVLIVLRVLQGIGLGFLTSSMHTVWSKWAPKDNKSRLITFSFAGYPLGTGLIMLFGGLIANYWSWEWIFYLSGIFAIIHAILWFYFIRESPSIHSTITPEELKYIESNLDQSTIRNYSIPWKSILTSLPVWAIIVAHFSSGWIMLVVITEFPIFLSHALHFSVDETGIVASLPWILYAIIIFIAGLLTDKLTKYYSTIYVRKLILSISFIISSLALLIVVLLKSNQRALIVIFLIIALDICALSLSTIVVNHLDIGGHYAGFLMGISNTFASIPGILGPILVAQLVPDTYLKPAWNVIFIITIAIFVCTILFYTLYGAANLQPWANYDSNEYQVVLNKSTPYEENTIDDLTNRIRAELDN